MLDLKHLSDISVKEIDAKNLIIAPSSLLDEPSKPSRFSPLLGKASSQAAPIYEMRKIVVVAEPIVSYCSIEPLFEDPSHRCCFGGCRNRLVQSNLLLTH